MPPATLTTFSLPILFSNTNIQIQPTPLIPTQTTPQTKLNPPIPPSLAYPRIFIKYFKSIPMKHKKNDELNSNEI